MQKHMHALKRTNCKIAHTRGHAHAGTHAHKHARMHARTHARTRTTKEMLLFGEKGNRLFE